MRSASQNVKGKMGYGCDSCRRSNQCKFAETENPTKVPLLRGKVFTAQLTDDVIRVDNLGTQPFLPWAAFQEAICVLIRNGGRAGRGDAIERQTR